jgi:hypothetical protein
VCFVYEFFEVIECAVVGVDGIIVDYVILVISRRWMYGHKPYSVEAHLFDVIKLGGYSVEIADAVVVGVIEAVYEYLIPVAIIVVNDVESHLFFLIAVIFLVIVFAGCKRRDQKRQKQKEC